MARLLPSLLRNQPTFTIPLPYICALIGTLCVFSFITFLCGSHGNPRPNTRKREKSLQLGEKSTKIATLQSNISSKALLMVKMISWKKIQDEDEEHQGVGDDAAVWRKKIIMGERCRPLDYSGKILYDSEGNLLPNKDQDKVVKFGN